MRYPIYFLLLLFIWSCSNDKIGKEEKETPTDTQEIASKYEAIFNEVKSSLDADDGEFWNHQLYGPILLIDPGTRAFIANQNNSQGSFQKIGNVFVDTLPKELNIANTAIDWDGKRWTMVMRPLPEDSYDRNNLIIHELFHRVQPKIGFDSLFEKSNKHLDTYEGRILLRLELEALKKTIVSEDDESQKTHLANALFFRNFRQSDEAIKASENSLEINEGLAEYTGFMLSGRNAESSRQHFVQNINNFFKNETYIRSFAYQTTPVYGYLLSKSRSDWQKEINRETILTDYFLNAFSIQFPNAQSYEAIAQSNDYNYQNIIEEEQERENQRIAKIEAYKKTFIESPTLKLAFRNMNVSFDPRNITPLEDLGTVYPTLRITDDWGILTVERGALLSADWSNVVVSQPTKITDDLVEGEGWKLELADGWSVSKTGGNYHLKQQ